MSTQAAIVRFKYPLQELREKGKRGVPRELFMHAECMDQGEDQGTTAKDIWDGDTASHCAC
jgi:hypothetical protein